MSTALLSEPETRAQRETAPWRAPVPRRLAWLAAARPDAFGRLYRFNQCPADYLHPTRRARFAGGAGDPVWSSARARRCLSERILRALDLVDRPWVELERSSCALALLDEARLLRLARHVGAAVLGAQVRRSMRREEVLDWKARLTPEIYAFVMGTATLLPAAMSPAPLDDAAPAEATGYAWIAAAMSPAPRELRARLELKLPADAAAAPVDGAHARHFVHSVHSALEPQWCSSFAMPRS